MRPFELRCVRRFTPAQTRYLDLMVLCLTRLAFGEAGHNTDPRAVDRVWWERRYAGGDWPSEAETMIGVPRLQNIIHCVATVVQEGLPGDLAECGVWRGGAAIMMRAVLAALEVDDRRVFVCDSFQGCPEPDSRYPADENDPHSSYSDVLAVPEEAVRANFERYQLMDDHVQFVPGFFEHSLPGPIHDLAVLRLDGDMYSSTIHTLDALYPRVSVGGFVIVDDFGGSGNGCQQAVEHYRDVHGVVEPVEWIGESGAIFWRKGL